MDFDDPKILIHCDCGFITAIFERNLDEIANGVWGPIPCIGCDRSILELIKDAHIQHNSRHQ